jgi:hypothetical protein
MFALSSIKNFLVYSGLHSHQDYCCQTEGMVVLLHFLTGSSSIFLQAEDSMVSQLSHAIKKVAERVTNAPETVEFDYFSSTNFIGLFITEQFSALLKQITTDFADESKKVG